MTHKLVVSLMYGWNLKKGGNNEWYVVRLTWWDLFDEIKISSEVEFKVTWRDLTLEVRLR